MINTDMEHYPSFISSQVEWPQWLADKAGRRAVTISRQAGCGALAVAEKLAHYLQARGAPNASPWTVFDRNLIDKVLEDHGLPAYLAKYLPEDRVSEFSDLITDVFGVHPSSKTVVQKTAATVKKLAGAGSVILIGRGATIATAQMPHVLHVRLVAPLEKRIEHCIEAYQMTREEARKFCPSEDEGRRRYMKKYFAADIEDPLLYHMIINTGLVSYADAARIIGDAVLNLS